MDVSPAAAAGWTARPKAGANPVSVAALGLTCRKCGNEAWCIDTATEGPILGCTTCDDVIAGDHADAMCLEQRLYVEAGRYRDRVEQAGSPIDVPIPASVIMRREQLMPGDREAYPLRGKLLDPNWPFHYLLPVPRAVVRPS